MRTLSLFTALYLLLLCSHGQDFNKISKKTASDRAALDRFGMATDISGGFAIVGASLEDHNAVGMDSLPQAGSAYIFGRGLGGNWTQVAKLVPTDRAAQDRFGFSVAIDGERAIVGAPNKTESGNQGQGAVYIFDRQQNGQWTQTQKLVYALGESQDNFGNAVSLKGNKAIVGAAFADPGGLRDAGRAHVYEQDSSGSWGQTAVLTASITGQGDSFGSSVDVDNNRLAIGAWFAKNNMPATNDDDAGAVYVFEKDTSNGQWSQTQKLIPDSTDWITGDLFGGTLDLDGNFLAIGADGDDVDENLQNVVFGAGAVHIFETNLNGEFVQVQKLVASDREENAFFGQKVSLNDGMLLVGAPGESEKVGGNDPNGKTAAGAAYLFVKNISGIWEEVQRLIPYDREAFDSFGFSLGMTDNYIIVSANQDDENELGQDSIPNTGSVYFFENCTLDKSVTAVDNSLTANLATASYQWVDCNLGNAIIPGASMQIFTPDSTGSYAVELIDDGCYVTSECTQVIISSNEKPKGDLAYLLYPNPSNGFYNLDIPQNQKQVFVEMYQHGRLHERISLQGKNTYELDFSALPSGIYLLRVRIGDKVYAQNVSLIR